MIEGVFHTLWSTKLFHNRWSSSKPELPSRVEDPKEILDMGRGFQQSIEQNCEIGWLRVLEPEMLLSHDVINGLKLRTHIVMASGKPRAAVASC